MSYVNSIHKLDNGHLTIALSVTQRSCAPQASRYYAAHWNRDIDAIIFPEV